MIPPLLVSHRLKGFVKRKPPQVWGGWTGELAFKQVPGHGFELVRLHLQGRAGQQTFECRGSAEAFHRNGPQSFGFAGRSVLLPCPDAAVAEDCRDVDEAALGGSHDVVAPVDRPGLTRFLGHGGTVLLSPCENGGLSLLHPGNVDEGDVAGEGQERSQPD